MNKVVEKIKAPRNRTLILSAAEIDTYRANLLHLTAPLPLEKLQNRIINQDLLQAVTYLPTQFVDLLFIDPPYNLNKSFNSTKFKKQSVTKYKNWFKNWFVKLLPTLKPTASVYVCGDWWTSLSILSVLNQYLVVQNRITWEREKGRGAKTNWKNCAEDIWFCTVSEHYTFNLEAVKIKRRVIAPYKDTQGQPKDWQRSPNGDYRLTHPSNIWTDLTVPFWSMRENTQHPTQKPEKMLAKVILASSNKEDLILDPFLGSGTTAVVAKKLARRYVGIELDTTYCCLAEKRLAMAAEDPTIQGYGDGVFWERNSSPTMKTAKNKDTYIYS